MPTDQNIIQENEKQYQAQDVCGYGVLQATIPVIDWQEGHSGELLSEEITAQQDEMWGEEQQG